MPEDAQQLAQAVQTALRHLQSGQAAAAESTLRVVLASQPTNADALHYLGVAALQQGRLQEAYDFIQRALQIAPDFAAFNNLGHVLWAARRTDEAMACFDRAAGLMPSHPDAFWNMGALLASVGRHELAIQPLQKLVAIQPSHPRAHLQLGISLVELRYFERAVAAFNEHLKIAPEDVECHGRKSAALANLNRFDEATIVARRAVELGPDRAEAHNNLAWVLEKSGHTDEAERCYRSAIALQPKYVMALGNLAALCERAGRVDEALSLFEQAAAADPRHLDAQCALAGCYSKAGRYQDALDASERALAIKPHDPAARGHRALSLLAFGKYEEGFAEYEWRWQCRDFTTPERDFPQPRYRGGDATGRTVFIHSEQGYGDNIQFARFLPLLAAHGARVVYECPVNLRRLMETVPRVAKVIPGGLRPPPFDLHAPLLSLPHAFHTTLETVPTQVPYFQLPDTSTVSWQSRIASCVARLRVGLLWRGNTKPNPKRSIPIESFAALAHDDITFFSLQVGEQAREAHAAPAGLKVVDFSAHITDFFDLAGLIASLDLIITIDSGPAHLAGALGKPTWTLLLNASDWRWLQHRDDSPWYPTMKLYRQPVADDWTPVLERVAADLHSMVR